MPLRASVVGEELNVKALRFLSAVNTNRDCGRQGGAEPLGTPLRRKE
ncbi:MAG: hypothetical protein ACR2ML_11355 [Solirubrobacteraceae bacterium]